MDMFGTILPLVLMFAIFYFLLIRPQQKKQKAVREMHSTLQRGDKIITIGGIHGAIDSVEEDTIVILVHDNRKLTLDRGAIREVVNPD